MNRIRYSILFLLSVLVAAPAFSQHTAMSLGQMTFKYFKENRMDKFFTLIPTIHEMGEFGKSLGFDSSSVPYKNFLEQYPLVIKTFKRKCVNIEADTAGLNVNWSAAQLVKVDTAEKTIPVNNRTNANRTIKLTIISIHFTSNKKEFVLQLGDAREYNGIWKPGNNIKIFTQ
jgi:hypothetical protein